MKPRQYLIAMVLSLALPVLPFAGSPIERNKAAGKHRPASLNKAYLDAFNILQQDNSCSRFFGGSNAAEEVLGQLIAHLQNERIQDNRV